MPRNKPRVSGARPSNAASGNNAASVRLIGRSTAVSVPSLSNIPWRFTSRWDEQPAGYLGLSLLRLGICRPEDWTGNAVDFVERGYTRFCKDNGAAEAAKVWIGSLRIMDSLFEMSELEYHNSRAEKDNPPDTLFLVGDYEQAASIPIGATLPYLEREHAQLPSAFYTALVHNLYKWMRVYDYTDAIAHLEIMSDGMSEEELNGSYLSQIATSVPKCLPSCDALLGKRSFTRAVSFLREHCNSIKGSIARRLVRDLLDLHHESRGHRHHWPAELVNDVPGLEEFLSEADGCGPGCAITWYEDDCISAAFDDDMHFVGQNGPIEPTTLLRIKLDADPKLLDKNVRHTFDFVGSMLRSLRIAARIVEQIRDVYDEYLREHRKKSGLQTRSGTAGVRQE